MQGSTAGKSDAAGTVFIFYNATSCPPTTGLCSGTSCTYGCLFCNDGLAHGASAAAGTFIGLAKGTTTGTTPTTPSHSPYSGAASLNCVNSFATGSYVNFLGAYGVTYTATGGGIFRISSATDG